MSELEGIGTAVTGAAAARAVEPRTGLDAGTRREGVCRNCGARLKGPYCHCCGQHAHVHRTIGAWWHDFLHSVLHLDGKFWLTLGLLAWRPGELTRRYAHGERARFVSPLALFLFTVFLMFAAMTAFGPKFDDFGMNSTLETSILEERQRLQRLGTSLESASGSERARLESEIADARDDIARLEELQRNGVVTGLDADSEIEGDALFKAVVAKARQNPELLIYKVQANAYKFSWALIPISVPFVWLLFLHRRRYRHEFTAYDHLVFVTYSISFMSLALIILLLIDAIGLGGGLAAQALFLLAPIHIYRQLRGAYLLSRVSALWRAIALSVFATIALGLFVTLLLAIGAVS